MKSALSGTASEHSGVISLNLHWEGIGDIIVCSTILHGLAGQHAGSEVRFYVNGGLRAGADKWLEWARLWWSNSFNAHRTPLAGKVYELGNPDEPANDPELTAMEKQFRHVLWAELCETTPRRFSHAPSPESMQKARAVLESIGLDLERPIVYLSPVTNDLERNWPMKCWRQLEEDLLSSTDAQILIGASRYRKWARRKDFEAFRSPFFLGCHPPDVLTAAMSMMTCIISNDSGFAHIGGILGIPTLAICGGPYDGNVVFGWYGGVRVVQAASGNIRRVRPDSVLNAVGELLHSRPIVQPRSAGFELYPALAEIS